MTNLQIVLGQARVEPKELTGGEWVILIESAKEMLTLEYLKGLESLRQILEKDDGFRRIVQPYNISNWLPKGMKPNAVFCHLTDVVDPPSDKDSFVHVEVPCVEYPKLKDLVPQPYEQVSLLLSKRGEFHLLKALWLLKEEERDVGRTFPSYETWCELDRIDLAKLEWRDLEALFTTNVQIPLYVLSRFFLVQNQTAMDLRSRARYGKARERKLAGLLNRLGYPV